MLQNFILQGHSSDTYDLGIDSSNDGMLLQLFAHCLWLTLTAVWLFRKHNFLKPLYMQPKTWSSNMILCLIKIWWEKRNMTKLNMRKLHAFSHLFCLVAVMHLTLWISRPVIAFWWLKTFTIGPLWSASWKYDIIVIFTGQPNNLS